MGGYYQRRWSRAALWCQRLALVSAIYFVLTILLHRFGKATTPQFFWLAAFGLLLLVISFSLGVRAASELWTDGRRGGRATVRGVVLTILLLLPFAWAGWLAVRYPPLSDVATDAVSPPAFVEIAKVRANGGAAGMNALADYDESYADLLAAAYPALGSRRYNTGAERVYGAVRNLIADRGWKVITTRGAPQGDSGDASAADKQAEQQSGGNDEGIVSQAPLDIEIEAVATDLIFGFKSDIAIRIVAEAESTLVDMRSASRYGPHDLGSNARRIEKFMTDLDSALAGLAGEG